jgi:hypothetical protein
LRRPPGARVNGRRKHETRDKGQKETGGQEH